MRLADPSNSVMRKKCWKAIVRNDALGPYLGCVGTNGRVKKSDRNVRFEKELGFWLCPTHRYGMSERNKWRCKHCEEIVRAYFPVSTAADRCFCRPALAGEDYSLLASNARSISIFYSFILYVCYLHSFPKQRYLDWYEGNLLISKLTRFGRAYLFIKR